MKTGNTSSQRRFKRDDRCGVGSILALEERVSRFHFAADVLDRELDIGAGWHFRRDD